MGLQLKALRKARRMTQEELAVRINQTARVVGSWERGEAALPIDDAARIADVFDCTLDELAGRDWHPSIPYADPRQAELNRCWESLDRERQDRLIGTAHDMEAAKNAGAVSDAPQAQAG